MNITCDTYREFTVWTTNADRELGGSATAHRDVKGGGPIDGYELQIG